MRRAQRKHEHADPVAPGSVKNPSSHTEANDGAVAQFGEANTGHSLDNEKQPIERTTDAHDGFAVTRHATIAAAFIRQA